MNAWRNLVHTLRVMRRRRAIRKWREAMVVYTWDRRRSDWRDYLGADKQAQR